MPNANFTELYNAGNVYNFFW